MSRSLRSFLMMSAIAMASPGLAKERQCLADDQTGAVAAVQAYYKALAARDYRAAFALWGNDGAASGKSFSQFSQGFAQTRSVSVCVLSVGQPDGAAGSIFIDVPVEVDAVLASGKAQHFAGTYSLRRVNDVPGSTPEQRRWHIQSAKMQVR